MRGDETSKELSHPAVQLVELAREELGEMSVRRRAEGFAKLTARRRRGSDAWRLLLGFAAVLAVAALVLIGRRWLGVDQEAALSYAVDGGRIDASGAIEAQRTTEPTLRFSDGTEVVFLAGARGRVRSVDEHGARIALTGKAKVEVVHWRGSPLALRRRPLPHHRQRNGVHRRMARRRRATGGRPQDGKRCGERSALRRSDHLASRTAAHHLDARERSRHSRHRFRGRDERGGFGRYAAMVGRTTTIRLRAPEAPPAEKPAHRSGAQRQPRPHRARPPRRASNWTAELAAGHFATILQQAEQRGLETSLAEVSSDDLAALADAARYSRREDVARRALTAQRRRFPRSARANDAAFLLGRLEETAQHPELALAWYERCLTESPRGTYTSEALGRKMTVVQRLYGAASRAPDCRRIPAPLRERDLRGGRARAHASSVIRIGGCGARSVVPAGRAGDLARRSGRRARSRRSSFWCALPRRAPS